jgi:hypothetical protein
MTNLRWGQSFLFDLEGKENKYARPFLYVVFATWFRQVESRHTHPPPSKNTLHMYLVKVVQDDIIDSHFLIGLPLFIVYVKCANPFGGV